MKLKLLDIVSSVESLNELVKTPLPVKVSYKLKRLADKFSPILETYNAKRNELIKEYGTENEGKYEVTDPEKVKIFVEKANELTSVEEEIDFEPIKIDELGDIKIQPKDLVTWVFIEE